MVANCHKRWHKSFWEVAVKAFRSFCEVQEQNCKVLGDAISVLWDILVSQDDLYCSLPGRFALQMCQDQVGLSSALCIR